MAEGEERVETPHPEPAEDQENIPPPAPVIRPPPCLGATGQHPHQFIAVHTIRGEEWRPISEFYQESIHNFHTVQQLCDSPPTFPGILPFRCKSPHYQTLYPRNRQLALSLGIQPLYACSQAILDHPSADLPLGSIRYNFRQGIREAFAPLNNIIKRGYVYSLAILEVQDFLDGRVITTYGYLVFHEGGVYAIEQGYHFEDLLQTSPHLIGYCFHPRIPADPFQYITHYPDHEVL